VTERSIGWDRVERARIAADKQPQFDRLLGQLGAPLYRLRQRLSVGDYQGVRASAESIASRFVDRNSPTAYLVMQALMWGRMAEGQREAACVPYFWCLEYVRRRDVDDVNRELPGSRKLQFEPKTGISGVLAPIWFDNRAAAQALPDASAAISKMTEPRLPATRLYFATLAIAAGKQDLALQAIGGLDGHDGWKALLTAQLAVQSGQPDRAIRLLTDESFELEENLRPVGLYWLGRAELVAEDPASGRRGLLDLLRITALFGEQTPEVSAAGLYQAMRQLASQGKARDSIAIRRELLDRFGQTWHAAQVRSEDPPAGPGVK